MEFKGKKSIITGSSRGIGATIARMFAKEGSDIVINYCKEVDITEDRAIEVLKEVEKIGRECIIVDADVSKEEGAKKLVEESMKVFGSIDILVNNAGGALRIPKGGFLDMPMDYWRSQIDLNLNAAAYCSHYVLKQMVKNNIKGRIINISSILSLITFEQRKTLPYCCAKAGINMLTKSLAVEFSKYGIGVNGIAPGNIITDATKTLFDKTWYEELLKRVPAGRVGIPEDIANLAVFLAADKSSFINGQTIYVDGGQSVDGSLYSMIGKDLLER